MKFITNRDHFAQALSLVLNIVGNKSTLPILSNVLLVAENDSISLTTTNLDVGMRCKIKAQVSQPGTITLPVKRLAAIVRELPALEVMVVGTPNSQVKLTSGGSTFKISGIAKDEFPVVAEVSADKVQTMDQAELATLIKNVVFAQSTDETRYILNGVYFSLKDNKLTLVATDGRRLAVSTKDLELPAVAEGAMILPAKTVGELARLLGKGSNVKFSFTDRRAEFQVETDKDESGLIDGVLLYSKVVEGNYPNYLQVIPKETHQRIKLERELFLSCVHRAALVCSEKANSVKLKFTANQLEIMAQSPDFGEAHESMALAYAGPDIQVAFNPSFLLDPLKAFGADEVFFEIKDDVSPGVFKTNNGVLCVVMPVRLS